MKKIFKKIHKEEICMKAFSSRSFFTLVLIDFKLSLKDRDLEKLEFLLMLFFENVIHTGSNQEESEEKLTNKTRIHTQE